MRLHDNSKTIADICFLLSSYVVSRKILDEFACQDCRSRSRSFLEGSRSISKLGLEKLCFLKTKQIQISLNLNHRFFDLPRISIFYAKF